MNKKIVSILLLVCSAALTSVFWMLKSSSSQQRIATKQSSISPPSLKGLGSNGFRLRYDASQDPKSSPEAMQNYYLRGQALIREFYGEHVLNKPLQVLADPNASRSDLLAAVSSVRRHELANVMPLVAALLLHQDTSIVRSAAEVLCWFRDKRGLDFVMSQIEGPDSDKWWGVFQKDFAGQNPTEYLPRIKALLTSKAGSRVDVYVAAQVLAQLGDADSARYLIPVIEREPHMSVDTILKLTNVRDPSVTALMQKLSKESSTNDVKYAADVVLANQGDVVAQQRLLDAAKRVMGLPQPQNADGTDKPGMKPAVFGEATPAWDGNAVFVLEHGMEVVDPAQAVPTLRDIAIQADNVRFSRTAIELLAKIGDEAARNALWEVARSVQAKRRTFEDTLFTTTGKALMLFGDETSASLATTMLSGDKHGMEVSQFLAETRGWDGLFKLDLFY